MLKYPFPGQNYLTKSGAKVYCTRHQVFIPMECQIVPVDTFGPMVACFKCLFKEQTIVAEKREINDQEGSE